MNQLLTISNSIRRTGALLAMVSLLATSLPIGVMIAKAANLYGPSASTLNQDTPQYASGAIDASGHQNLNFSFSYNAEQLDSGDSFTYGWRSVGGTNTDLGTVSGANEVGTTTPSDETGSVSVSLPAGAQISNLEVYFTAVVNSGSASDFVSLSSINISGDLIPAPTLEENAVCDSGCEYTTLAAAVAGETDGQTITLKNQIHTITDNISVNKDLTIIGETGSAIKTSGGNIILTITANGVTLDSLVFEKTDSVNQNIIQINANNVTVEDSTFSGTYTDGDGQLTRAFEVVGGKTGLLITGNNISKLRQPAYINNTTSGNITNNYVADTRGWVIVSDTALTFTGNTWGANAVDIAIIEQSSTNLYTCEMVAQIIVDNNGADVVNQDQSPACPPPPVVVTSPVMPSLDGQIIYNSIPSPLPPSVPSQGYQATQTYELGDSIVFGGTSRELVDAAITLTSWACESGEWNLGTCSTTPGATFPHPITLNLYEVALDGTAGTLIASKTQTFDIPFRPSSNATCTDTKQWKDVNGNCFNGYNHVVVFDVTGVTSPDEVIFGIAYNTQSYGAAPAGANGPYNSLNVGLNTDVSAPYIGTDVNTDEVFWDTTYSGATRGFKADNGWTPYKVAIAFTATATPPVIPSQITSPATDGATVSGSTTLAAFYSDENDDGNDGIQWAVRTGSCSSGTVFGNVDGHNDVATWNGENFSIEFDTTSVANGSYCFVFNPSEDSGHDNQRLTRQFTINNISAPPTVTIETPTPLENSYVKGMITGRAVATDDVGMGSYYLRFWKGAFESGIDNLVANCQMAPGADLLGTDEDASCSYNSTLNPDGVYVFSAQFQDSDIQWGSAQRSFIVDNTRPVVTLVEPSDSEIVFATSTASFTIDATDNFALNKIVGNIYQNGVLYKSNSQTATGTADSYSFDVLNLPEGEYNLRYNATDKAGNVASTKNVDFTVAYTAPEVPTHLSPANNSSQNFNVFTFDWTDVVGAVEYEFQSSQNPAVGGDGAFTSGVWNNKANGAPDRNYLTESEIDSYGANGTWYWQVRAIGVGGVKSAWSSPWKMTIDATAPAIPTGLGWTESDGDSVADNGTTELVAGTATWAANSESDLSHYIYKYWNNIPTSAYNGEANAWSANNITTNSLSGVFNQGEGTHYFCIIAVDNASNQSDCSDEFTITYDTNPTTPPDPTASSTVQTVNGDTASGENQFGWLFNRDAGTQSPFEFVLGTSTIGLGSLFVEPIANTINGNADKFIAELFLLAPIADLSKISYDFNIASNDNSDADQFYINLYTNFGTSSPTKYYDCRYDIVANIGTLNGWTNLSINPSTGVVTGGSISNVQKHSSSPYNCPATPNGMDLLSADSTVRAVAITVGDSSASDAGVSGYLDNVIVIQKTDSHTQTTTYDFEAADPAPSTPSVTSNGGGGSGGGSNSGPDQRVLGVSTDSDAYAMLQEIKNRLAELLVGQYVIPTGTTPAPTTGPNGQVLGESTTLAQADTSEDEEDEVEEEIDSILRDEEDDEETPAATTPWWGQFLWIFVALWILSTIGGYWRKSVANDVRSLVVIQAAFGAIAFILLAGYLFFGLTAALWPSLIVIAGSAIVYYLNK